MLAIVFILKLNKKPPEGGVVSIRISVVNTVFLMPQRALHPLRAARNAAHSDQGFEILSSFQIPSVRCDCIAQTLDTLQFQRL